MGLIAECADVFSFLRDFFSLLPVAIRLLVYGCFGGIIWICVMRSFWR